MEATATLKYFKMSARKVRLVANVIRGKKLDKAVEILAFLDKKAAKPISTLLQSCAANAGSVEGMDTESLFVSRILVNEGPTGKRFMPRAMGRASMIQKKTCHVEISLQDKPKKIIKTEKIDKEIKTEENIEKTAKKIVKKTAKKTEEKATKKTVKKVVKKTAKTSTNSKISNKEA